MTAAHAVHPARCISVGSAAILLMGLIACGPAWSQPVLDAAIWHQRLNQSVPLQLEFRDSQAHSRELGHYFGGRPIALVLMYLSCSQLCPVTLGAIQRTLDRAGLIPGRDLDVLAVSIDPWDTPAIAARRAAQLGGSDAWRRSLRILTAVSPRDDAAARLAAAIGFGYRYDAATRQYAHPAGWVLIDPDGRIQHYFFGLGYSTDELRSAVRRAAARAPATWSQPLRMLCYCLQSLSGRADALVLTLLRVLCVAGLAAAGTLLWRTLHRSAVDA